MTLKPCPFCGGAVSVKFIPNYEDVIGPPGPVPWFAVSCESCHIIGPRVKHFGIGCDNPGKGPHVDKSKEDAIKLWNNRK